MAVTNSTPSATATTEPWATPVWPSEPPDPARVRVAYGPIADELVVRFAATAGRPAVVVAIETPDRDYAFVLADAQTGAVVGVQVDNLRAVVGGQVDDLRAVVGRLHPDWTRLAEPAPSVTAVAAFLADVRGLLARHGAGETMPTG